MKKGTKDSIQFTMNYLNNLKEDKSSCVVLKKQECQLKVHYLHFNNINNTVKKILDQRIPKYNKEYNIFISIKYFFNDFFFVFRLGGIILGYQNIEVLQGESGVTMEGEFIPVNIKAKVFVFTPEVDAILSGIVNKKSKDHLGCLVHNIFNVSIPKPSNCEEWIGDFAKLKQEIQFKITFIKLKSRLPYIRGEIM